MAWTSPRSSVTWWGSSGWGQLAAVDGGPLGRRDVDAERGEGRGRGAGARRGWRAGAPADALEGGPELVGDLVGHLGERVANDPGPVSVVRRPGGGRLVAEEGRGRRQVDGREAPERPGQRLLDVGLGVAHEVGE